MEDEYRGLSNAQLQAKTPEFKARLANGETLDDLLPEAFAVPESAGSREALIDMIVMDTIARRR